MSRSNRSNRQVTFAALPPSSRPGSSPSSPSPSSFSSSSPGPCSSPLTVSSAWLLSSGLPTTVYVQLPDDRSYSALLRQTEVVYDQLLAERQRKLQEKINGAQTQYLDRYRHLMQTDRVKASEYERWAIGALTQLKSGCSKELDELRQDYESKFVKMRISLEEQSMADHRSHQFTAKTSPQRQQPQPHHHHHHTMHLINRN